MRTRISIKEAVALFLLAERSRGKAVHRLIDEMVRHEALHELRDGMSDVAKTGKRVCHEYVEALRPVLRYVLSGDKAVKKIDALRDMAIKDVHEKTKEQRYEIVRAIKKMPDEFEIEVEVDDELLLELSSASTTPVIAGILSKLSHG